jgi:Ca2+-binding RTX toxin-like protein
MANAAAKAATGYAARLLTPSGDSRGDTLQLTGAANVNDLSVLNLLNMSNDATVQVSNISNLLVTGPGSVSISGTSACVLVGDTFNQTFTGGPGNDVLGGGGGNDVLYGGAGKDTFLLGGTGRVTIGDFAAGDVMKFNIPGVNSLATLLTHMTSSKPDSQSMTYAFDTGLSVTLVGITLSTVFTADMFAFGA